MSPELETETMKHFVVLWEKATVWRRKQIVIQAPADLNMKRLRQLDGKQLAQMGEDYGYDADWELVDIEPHEYKTDISLSGYVPDEVSADIVFVRNESGHLVDADSDEPAPFLD